MLIDSLRPDPALPGLCPTVMCSAESFPLPPTEGPGSHLEPNQAQCADCGDPIPEPPRCPKCAIAENYRLWEELHKIFTRGDV